MTVKELIEWLSIIKETAEVKIHVNGADRPFDVMSDIDIDRRDGSIVIDPATLIK